MTCKTPRALRFDWSDISQRISKTSKFKANTFNSQIMSGSNPNPTVTDF